MIHLTEARPMCGAIFSQATSRLLRIALLCRPTPPPRASHARLDPALLQRPAGRPYRSAWRPSQRPGRRVGAGRLGKPAWC